MKENIYARISPYLSQPSHCPFEVLISDMVGVGVKLGVARRGSQMRELGHSGILGFPPLLVLDAVQRDLFCE